MKIWLDDIREAPEGWVHARSVNETITIMRSAWEHDKNLVTDISLDHDLGDYAHDGGDAIKFVLWMAEFEIWPFNKPTFHTANPVGRANMEAVVTRYGPYE